MSVHLQPESSVILQLEFLAIIEIWKLTFLGHLHFIEKFLRPRIVVPLCGQHVALQIRTFLLFKLQVHETSGFDEYGISGSLLDESKRHPRHSDNGWNYMINHIVFFSAFFFRITLNNDCPTRWILFSLIWLSRRYQIMNSYWAIRILPMSYHCRIIPPWQPN